MLTSTYTLVSLSVEHTTVRTALHAILRELHAWPEDCASLAPGRAAELCAELRRVVEACRSRKLDRFLVPALRRRTGAADAILGELEQLSSAASAALAAAEACIDAGRRALGHADFQQAVERCVAALRRRLECEEYELFPLARSVVRGEDWFAVANQMLAHDATVREQRDAGRGGYGRRDAFACPAPGQVRPEAAELEHAGFGHGRYHGALTSMH